jgi:hypothetical protein
MYLLVLLFQLNCSQAKISTSKFYIPANIDAISKTDLQGYTTTTTVSTPKSLLYSSENELLLLEHHKNLSTNVRLLAAVCAVLSLLVP